MSWLDILPFSGDDIIDETDATGKGMVFDGMKSGIGNSIGAKDNLAGKEIFTAVILSHVHDSPTAAFRPEELSAILGSNIMSEHSQNPGWTGYRVRIVDEDSPHDFYPVPCDPSTPAGKSFGNKIVINMHTMMVTPKVDKAIFSVGSLVKIRLKKMGASYDLSYCFLESLVQTAIPGDGANYFEIATSKGFCADIKVAKFDEREIRTIGAEEIALSELENTPGLLISDESTTDVLLNMNITSPFPRRHSGAAHGGVDYSAPAGTPVRAMANGTIHASSNVGKSTPCKNGDKSCGGGFGNRIYLLHEATANDPETGTQIGNGKIISIYAHFHEDRPFPAGLKIGDKVKAGQVIGYVGNTGHSFGNHLHLELHIGGLYGKHRVDPDAYMALNNESGNLRLSFEDEIITPTPAGSTNS